MSQGQVKTLQSVALLHAVDLLSARATANSSVNTITACCESIMSQGQLQTLQSVALLHVLDPL
jgi:hypothetical protein